MSKRGRFQLPIGIIPSGAKHQSSYRRGSDGGGLQVHSFYFSGFFLVGEVRFLLFFFSFWAGWDVCRYRWGLQSGL